MELTPAFSIIINGQSNFPIDRVISIKSSDQAGFVSDFCEFELDDFDNAITMPNTEAKFELSLGYKETGLTKIGTYFVKEIILDGARRVIKIKGNAACKAMLSQKTKNHEGSLSDVVSSMASDVDLDGVVADEFDELDLDEEVQFAESDISYLTRKAYKVGGIVKPVDGHLVFSNDMEAKSASGKELPTKYLETSEVINYSCSFRETETGGGKGTIWANWYDKEAGEYHLVKAGDGDSETELNEIFSSEKEALAAANSRLKTVSKNNTTFRFSTAGRPDLFAESPLVLRGFPSKIPTRWIISKVEHQLNSSGFSTSVDCCSVS